MNLIGCLGPTHPYWKNPLQMLKREMDGGSLHDAPSEGSSPHLL